MMSLARPDSEVPAAGGPAAGGGDGGGDGGRAG